MNQAPLADIKAKLKLMYPNYHFEINYNRVIPIYNLYIYQEKRGTDRVASLSFAPETSLTVVWDMIREAMINVIRKS